MGRTASTGRAARLLAVLAVLLGLVAMHGLASTHHAAAAVSHAPAASPESEAPAHGHAGHLPSAAADVDGGLGGSCEDGCPDLAVLCLAVLTGVALLLLLVGRGLPARLLPQRAPDEPAPAGPGRCARGPDPVRELCISRT